MSVRRSAVLVLAAAVLLAGCQDEPEPEFDPTPTGSGSPSDPSEEPEAQTAEEFIEEWVELQREMQNTGDTEEFLAASPGCRSCLAAAQLVEGYYAEGGYVRTKGRSILDISELKRDRVYDVRVRSAPTEYKQSASGQLETFPGGVTTYRVTLKFDGEWGLTDEVEVSDS